MTDMIRAITPILLANALIFLFIYGVWSVYNREPKTLGEALLNFAAVLIPSAVILYGLHLWGFTEATPFRHLLAAPPQAMPMP